MVGSTRTKGVAPRRPHDRKRVASTPAKKVAGGKRRVISPNKHALEVRLHRDRLRKWERLVESTVQRWSAMELGDATIRRLKTASRAKGGRPLTHNLFNIGVHDKVKVLVGVQGAKHEGVWIDSKVVAVRQLRLNHPKVVKRKLLNSKGEVEEMPSSVVVVEDTRGAKPRRDHGMLICVDDWQVIPQSFFGQRSHALLEAKLCKRRAAGANSLLDDGSMLSQNSDGRQVKVIPRGRRCFPRGEFPEDRFADSDDE